MPALTTDTGSATGTPLNDCYGSLTQTAGTEILRVVPPSVGRACVGNFRYEAAATAHTLTLMQALDSTTVSTDAALGATTVTMGGDLTDGSGGVIAANDFVIMQYESGAWEAHKVSSVSGRTLTVPATTAKILAGSTVYMMGAPSDHTSRQFTMKASTTTDFISGDLRIRAATAAMTGYPILVHSNNATNAGTLYWLSFYYD